ncbi:hypothetical protein P7C70_g6365, partial [Phenoliferia sp. Uapishka_3]
MRISLLRCFRAPLLPSADQNLTESSDHAQSILIQATGASFTDSDSRNVRNIAEWILKAGFIIQVVGIAVFLAMAYFTERKARLSKVNDLQWTQCLRLLYIGGSIILFRSTYRFLEITIKSHGTEPLSDHE